MLCVFHALAFITAPAVSSQPAARAIPSISSVTRAVPASASEPVTINTHNTMRRVTKRPSKPGDHRPRCQDPACNFEYQTYCILSVAERHATSISILTPTGCT
eukprot:8010-Heterococcus_DN1.PRE.2